MIFFKTSRLQGYIYILLYGVIDFLVICYFLIHVKSYLQIAILNRLYLSGIVPSYSDDFHNLRNNVRGCSEGLFFKIDRIAKIYFNLEINKNFNQLYNSDSFIVGYRIPVPDFYLVLHGLRCRKSTIMDKTKPIHS